MIQVKQPLIYLLNIYINFEIFIFKHHVFDWITDHLPGIFYNL